MKHQIMEVLLSGDNNLTKEQIQWAITNIPEDGKSFTYDHTQEDVWAACGIDKEMNSRLIDEYRTIKNGVEGTKKSQLIEDFFTKASPDLQRSFLIRAICEFENEIQREMLEKLQKLIDKMK